MKHLILVLTLTFSSLSFSQSISKQVIGAAGKTLTNPNLKLSYTVGEPVAGLMTAGGNQLGSHPLKRVVFNFHKNKDFIFGREVEQFINPKNNLYFDLIKS